MIVLSIFAMLVAAAPQDGAGARVPAAIVPQVQRYADCFVDQYAKLQHTADYRRTSDTVRAAFAGCAAVRAAQMAEADAILARRPAYANPAVRRAALDEAFGGYERTELSNLGRKPEGRSALPFRREIAEAYTPYFYCRAQGERIASRGGVPTYRSRSAEECASVLSQSRLDADAALARSGVVRSERAKLIRAAERKLQDTLPGGTRTPTRRAIGTN